MPTGTHDARGPHVQGVHHIVRGTRIVPSARTLQLSGLFDIPPNELSQVQWDVILPLAERPWNIGLIVGPSGSGKTTVLRELFGAAIVHEYEWSDDRSIVDGFPAGVSIKTITEMLSSVGFSSPPNWLRPYQVLSTGEQFRVHVARALLEPRDLVALDEFTSVVDRTVAQVGSAAVARSVRRLDKRLVVATCHYDVEDWLQPDWIYLPHLNEFHWRELQRRPPIVLDVARCGSETWQVFRQHHYLNTELNRSARCFVAQWRGNPVAFTAVLPMMGHKGQYREHRTVCLPDYQGVGIGMAMSTMVASIVKAAIPRVQYRSVTSHPAFIAARVRSGIWRMVQAPSFAEGHRTAQQTSATRKTRSPRRLRLAASFVYTGVPFADAALARSMWEEKLGVTTR